MFKIFSTWGLLKLWRQTQRCRGQLIVFLELSPLDQSSCFHSYFRGSCWASHQSLFVPQQSISFWTLATWVTTPWWSDGFSVLLPATQSWAQTGSHLHSLIHSELSGPLLTICLWTCCPVQYHHFQTWHRLHSLSFSDFSQVTKKNYSPEKTLLWPVASCPTPVLWHGSSMGRACSGEIRWGSWWMPIHVSWVEPNYQIKHSSRWLFVCLNKKLLWEVKTEEYKYGCGADYFKNNQQMLLLCKFLVLWSVSMAERYSYFAYESQLQVCCG